MNYFHCVLAITDLVLCISILPKMLAILWFNAREIEFSACLTQLYFFHGFTMVESGVLVAMALDCYMANCHPLRHSTILTNALVAKIGLVVLLHGGILALPYPFLMRQCPYCRTNVILMVVAKISLAVVGRGVVLSLPYLLLARQLPYCRTNIIPHAYCEHIAVVKLACADIRVNNYYGLIVAIFVTSLDLSCIAVSYTQILRAIFRLPTKDARLKTFGTCSSHLFVILASYTPALFSFLTYDVPLYFHVLFASMYLLVPSMLNPIIYGVRTKQIRDRLLWHMTPAD
nr:olfactory receptor 52R1-like [Pelodiscus sinensis]|eukprot:XP_025038305.1 olfactory receptor 52R1-like [Pelodiscus sinensis]